MLNQFDIAIVGSFYNLAWLASELARQGWNVLYLDLYAELGHWATEDIEGPFGFFNTELLNPHFVEKYNYEEPYVSQDRGWTLCLPQGPVEFKSPLLHYQLNSLGVNAKFIERLSKSTESYYKSGVTSNFSQLDFSQNWLEYFAHSFTQTQFSTYNDFKPSPYPLPLMNSFFVRSLSRRSLEFSHQWLVNQNIKVSYQTKILDLINADKKNIKGFELKGEYSGIVKFDEIIWGLSSEETHYYNNKIGDLLFPNSMVEPEWVWSRYSLDVEVNRESKELPLHTVWISDLFAPWTHENVLIVQRTIREEMFNVWIKIPNTQRFNKDYLRYYGEKILKCWKEKFDSLGVVISHYPQEFEYTYQHLGPSRFVQFSKNSKKQRLNNEFHNVSFSSYETLESLNKETFFQDQMRVVTSVTNKLKLEKVKELE